MPGATAAAVAKRHKIGTGQIYTWRGQALADAAGGFMPVTVSEEIEIRPVASPGPALPTPPRSAPSPRRGVIEIVLANGIQLRVGNDVDGAALRCVLATKVAGARRSSAPSSRLPSSTVSIRKPTWRTQSTGWPRSTRSTGSLTFCRGTGKQLRPPSSAPPDPSRHRHYAYRLTLTLRSQREADLARRPPITRILTLADLPRF